MIGNLTNKTSIFTEQSFLNYYLVKFSIAKNFKSNYAVVKNTDLSQISQAIAAVNSN